MEHLIKMLSPLYIYMGVVETHQTELKQEVTTLTERSFGVKWKLPSMLIQYVNDCVIFFCLRLLRDMGNYVSYVFTKEESQEVYTLEDEEREMPYIEEGLKNYHFYFSQTT